MRELTSTKKGEEPKPIVEFFEQFIAYHCDCQEQAKVDVPGRNAVAMDGSLDILREKRP